MHRWNLKKKSSPKDMPTPLRERERETPIGCLPYTPLLGIKPTT